jgi:hypothetical protein
MKLALDATGAARSNTADFAGAAVAAYRAMFQFQTWKYL